ncbi:MAG: glycosyltransferase, partial [Chloroflexota bacterium]
QRRRKGETIPLLTDWVDWWGRGGIIDISRPAWYRRTLGPVETYYEEAFRTRADGLTVISHGLAERAIRMGVDPGRILRIPNGTHLDDFPLRDKLACRQHLGIAADIPLLGFSSLDSHLDLDLIMVALHHLKCEFPNIKLLITGRTSEHVMQSAATHGVAEHIFLSGFVPFEALSWYLGACDVFVLPFPDTIYNRGRWPNKIADYMSVGRPVVTNPVGEVGHLLGQHPIGLMTEWDATTFSEAIAVLLRDPARADNMGQQARRLAETTYNWQTLITTLEKFYLNHIDFAQMKVRSAALNWHSSQ